MNHQGPLRVAKVTYNPFRTLKGPKKVLKCRVLLYYKGYLVLLTNQQTNRPTDILLWRSKMPMERAVEL